MSYGQLRVGANGRPRLDVLAFGQHRSVDASHGQFAGCRDLGKEASVDQAVMVQTAIDVLQIVLTTQQASAGTTLIERWQEQHRCRQKDTNGNAQVHQRPTSTAPTRLKPSG